MATSAANVKVGAGTFSIGAYTSAGAAGSLTDSGHIATPYELGVGMENFDVETERSTGIVYTSPQKDEHTLKVAFHESTLELWRTALGQPSSQLTGTAPNKTLRVGDRAAQYHQATLAVPGVGTTAARTLTFWKLQVIALEPIQFGKAVAQVLTATFRILRDDTVSTADKYYKVVDA